MPRRAREVECSEADRSILQAMLRDMKLPVSRKKRAAIILDCCAGMAVKDVASKNFASEPTVIKWRNRFLEFGLSGLCTKNIPGRPLTYAEEFRKTIFATLEKTPPAGFSQWNGSLLAQVTGYSKDAIWQLLRNQRSCLQRKCSWCISTDPEFAEKAADIVGLYIAPPENAIVLCVDEKPNIQVLERRSGYAVSSEKKFVHGLESTYKRHGTLNLFSLYSHKRKLDEHGRNLVRDFDSNIAAGCQFFWGFRSVQSNIRISKSLQPVSPSLHLEKTPGPRSAACQFCKNFLQLDTNHTWRACRQAKAGNADSRFLQGVRRPLHQDDKENGMPFTFNSAASRQKSGCGNGSPPVR